MQSDAESSHLPMEDYQAIEDAVMETARGRWFLAEYARRHRAADTLAIVGTLERLEKAIRRDRQVPDIDRIRLDLADMAEAIHRTKQEIAQMQIETGEGGRFAAASSELDAIVGQTETATNDILLNAEKVQELAWTLREAGVDAAFCDALDQSATQIYTACSFQDLTGQRTRKVVTVLRYLESRIHSMIGIWGMDRVEDATVVAPAPAGASSEDTRPDAHLLNGPPAVGDGIGQSAVDDLMDAAAGPEEADEPFAPEPAAAEAAVDERAAGAAEDAGEAVADHAAAGAAAEAEAEAGTSPEEAAPRALSSADFVVNPRRAYTLIDDDVPIVVPEEIDFVDFVDAAAPAVAPDAAADVFATEPAGAGADRFAPDTLPAPSTAGPADAAPDIFAEADVFAPAGLDEAPAPAVAPREPAGFAEADLFAEADVFAPASRLPAATHGEPETPEPASAEADAVLVVAAEPAGADISADIVAPAAATEHPAAAATAAAEVVADPVAAEVRTDLPVTSDNEPDTYEAASATADASIVVASEPPMPEAAADVFAPADVLPTAPVQEPETHETAPAEGDVFVATEPPAAPADIFELPPAAFDDEPEACEAAERDVVVAAASPGHAEIFAPADLPSASADEPQEHDAPPAQAADIFAPAEAPPAAFDDESEAGVAAAPPEADAVIFASADVSAEAADREPEAYDAAPDEADVFVAAEPTDVFAAPVVDAPAVPDAAPRPAARAGRGGGQAAVIGNVAVALVALAEPAAAPAARPDLAVVPADDPIAALRPAERLILFG